jgi:hypothetical protein
MYHLINTFNNDRLISRHRTLVAAVKASIKHDRAVKKYNGQNSYIPTKIVEVVAGEETPVDMDEVHTIEYSILSGN